MEQCKKGRINERDKQIQIPIHIQIMLKCYGLEGRKLALVLLVICSLESDVMVIPMVQMEMTCFLV